MDDKLLEPLKYYEGQGKQEHHDNIEAHLNKLVEQSGVNLEENRATVSKWQQEQKKISELSKVISKFKTIRGLLIAAIVIGAILLIASFGVLGDSGDSSGIALLVIGIIAIIVPIIVIVKKINPILKNTNAVLDEHQQKAKQLENEGWAQMSALNNLFTDDDAVRLMEKTLPDFSFEKNFTKAHERLFYQKYDYYDLQDVNCSMLDTLSGTYAGNPFLYGRRRVHKMGTEIYRGSLLITWTETYRDSQGNVRTRQRSQTLMASVTKPKPFYHTNTFLAYGNQAAPTLNFSRQAKHTEDLSEKALERTIKKGEQRLHKQAENAIKNGGNFQEMANSEFDVLFGATNRSNEVEFRFMYTPIGQRSTVALLKDSKNYGDDFEFIKRGKCNLIISEHAQGWKMNIFASDYKHFNFEEIRNRFITLNMTFFKSIFFDFAPLFAVPAYLDEPCASLDDIEPYDTNYTYYEHEVMANTMNVKPFLHEDSSTEAILKTKIANTSNGRDVISVTANSYKGVNRVDFIPVRGGDGRMHPVPVHWIEYIPVSKTTPVYLSGNADENDSGSIYYHGISAGIIK